VYARATYFLFDEVATAGGSAAGVAGSVGGAVTGVVGTASAHSAVQPRGFFEPSSQLASVVRGIPCFVAAAPTPTFRASPTTACHRSLVYR
jgi:hypothetical protein